MRQSPSTHPFPQFTGQRVRSAEVVVELAERKPFRIVRATFDILTFDQTGCLDTAVLSRQQFARFETAQSKLGADADKQQNVLDARYLLEDRGGRWVPTEDQLRTIYDAALGKKLIARL
jgi:hypothetical protein